VEGTVDMDLTDYESRTILIIDDRPDVLATFSHALRSAGIKKVYTAENGEHGIKLCKENKVDLVLLDLAMDVTDGWEVLERLKQEGLKPNGVQTKVIIFTVDEEIDSATKAIRAGATDYLLKRNFITQGEARIRKAFENGDYVAVAQGRQVLIRLLEDIDKSLSQTGNVDSAAVAEIRQAIEGLKRGNINIEKNKFIKSLDTIKKTVSNTKHIINLIEWITNHFSF
jgi:CheY-like chemotaxis protein